MISVIWFFVTVERTTLTLTPKFTDFLLISILPEFYTIFAHFFPEFGGPEKANVLLPPPPLPTSVP